MTKKETFKQGTSLTEIYLGKDAFLEMILFNCVSLNCLEHGVILDPNGMTLTHK